MNRAYIEIRYPYHSSRLKDALLLLGDMLTAGTNVWDIRNLALKDAKMRAPSQECHIKVDVVGLDLSGSAAAVLSNGLPI